MSEHTGYAAEPYRQRPALDTLDRLELTGPDDVTATLVNLGVMEIDGQSYALMCPADETGDLPEEERSLYVFACNEVDGTMNYEPVSDEDVYDEVLHMASDLYLEPDEEE